MVLRWSLVGLCLLLGLVVRLSNYEFFLSDLSGGSLNFFDSDSYYHLRRFFYFLENFPDPLWFDPLVNWPVGSEVNWPEGFLFLYGLPLKLFGVASFRELEWGVTILNLFFGLLFAVSVFRVARLLFSDWAAQLLVLFFACLNYLMVRFSALGALDHHLFEAMVPILFFLIGHRVFLATEIRWGSTVLSAVLVAFSLLISSSSLFAIGGLFLWGVLLCHQGRRMALVGVLAAILLLPYWYWYYRSTGVVISVAKPSQFQVSALILLSVMSLVWSVWSGRSRRIAVAAMAGILVVILVFRWPAALAHYFYSAFDYVFLKPGVLGQVQETSFIFMDFDGFEPRFMHSNFSYLIYILPIAWILGGAGLFAKYRSRLSLSSMEWGLILWTCVLSIPAVFQKRFSHLVIGFFILFLGFVMQRLSQWMKRNDLRLNGIAYLFVVCMIVFPGFGNGFAPNGSPRDFVDLGSVSVFKAVTSTSESQVRERLSLRAKPEGGALVHPNAGHAFLYLTGIPTVTSAFYHHRAMKLDFEARTALGLSGLADFLQEHKIRYLFVQDDWLYWELLFRWNGQETSEFIREEIRDGKNTRIFEIGNLAKFGWVELFMARSPSQGPFENLFQVQIPAPHFYQRVSGWALQASNDTP